jgi:hypothetical protein
MRRSTKGHNYFWIPERLNILKEVLLTATSLEDAAVKMRNHGIVCNRDTISTIANKPENRFLRPNMNKKGAGRKPKNDTTN